MAAYVTVTKGLRGYFAVLVENELPALTGFTSFDTMEDAADDARVWAEAEGVPYKGPDND